MTYEQFRYVFIGAAIAAGVFLLLSVLLFFVLDIRAAFGYVTGRSAKKAIKKIREENQYAGMTDIINKNSLQGRTGVVTSKIATQSFTSDETTVLNEEDSNETTVLSDYNPLNNVFEIEYEITFIHTDEVIG